MIHHPFAQESLQFYVQTVLANHKELIVNHNQLVQIQLYQLCAQILIVMPQQANAQQFKVAHRVMSNVKMVHAKSAKTTVQAKPAQYTYHYNAKMDFVFQTLPSVIIAQQDVHITNQINALMVLVLLIYQFANQLNALIHPFQFYVQMAHVEQHFHNAT